MLITSDLSDENRAALFARVEAMRATQLAKARNRAAFVLNRQLGRVLATAKKSGIYTQDELPSLILASDWEEFFAKTYTDAANIFSKELQTKKSFFDDVVIAQVLLYVRSVSGQKISDINDTTIGIYREVFAQSIAEGLGISETMALLRERLTHLNAMRAERIARTEIVAASNAGSFAGAQSLGEVLTKIWLSSPDSRTRGTKPTDPSSHVALNGQEKEMNEAFVEGRTGARMMFPGDSSLGAGANNVANCRCTLIYKRI
jgi:hypothetical protein